MSPGIMHYDRAGGLNRPFWSCWSGDSGSDEALKRVFGKDANGWSKALEMN